MRFDLKTFVTVCMTSALIVLTFMEKIDSGLFISTCGAVFAYYFNRKKENEPDDRNQEVLNEEKL